jgi:hypothetical protein
MTDKGGKECSYWTKGDYGRIYYNGVQVHTSDSIFDEFIGTTEVTAKIGYNEWGTFFNGCIDEVRLSNIGRSAARNKASYNTLWNTLLTYGKLKPAGAVFFGANF